MRARACVTPLLWLLVLLREITCTQFANEHTDETNSGIVFEVATPPPVPVHTQRMRD